MNSIKNSNDVIVNKNLKLILMYHLLNINQTDQKLKELQLKFDEKIDEVKKNQLRLNENELKLKELQELNSNLNDSILS